MVVSEVDTFVPERMLEDMPSSSLTKEHGSTEGSSEKGQDGRSSVQLEESTGKEDEMDHPKETPRYSGDLLVKESVDSEEEVQRLSKKEAVSEPEMGDHSDASKVGMVPLEDTMTEDVDLPASSIETEGKGIDRPSEVLDGSSVKEGPKTPVADKDTQVNAPDACEREPEVVSESVDMPPVTSTMVDDGVKGSSEAVPIGSSKAPEMLESEAKIFDSVECLSEARLVGSSESPESKPEAKVADAPEESKSEAKVADASEVSETMPEVASENADQPPVNMAVEGDSIKGLSEAGPVGISEPPEESKSEAKFGDASPVSGTMPENASEDMDIEPSMEQP